MLVIRTYPCQSTTRLSSRPTNDLWHLFPDRLCYIRIFPLNFQTLESYIFSPRQTAWSIATTIAPTLVDQARWGSTHSGRAIRLQAPPVLPAPLNRVPPRARELKGHHHLGLAPPWSRPSRNPSPSLRPRPRPTSIRPRGTFRPRRARPLRPLRLPSHCHCHCHLSIPASLVPLAHAPPTRNPRPCQASRSLERISEVQGQVQVGVGVSFPAARPAITILWVIVHLVVGERLSSSTSSNPTLLHHPQPQPLPFLLPVPLQTSNRPGFPIDVRFHRLLCPPHPNPLPPRSLCSTPNQTPSPPPNPLSSPAALSVTVPPHTRRRTHPPTNPRVTRPLTSPLLTSTATATSHLKISISLCTTTLPTTE